MEAVITGGGSGPDAAVAFSIARLRALAFSLRPFDSSQRGDSGRFLRRYQTISEPMPAMMNIGRQPQVGMISQPRIAVTGKPHTVRNAMKASQRPRVRGGTNSVMVE